MTSTIKAYSACIVALVAATAVLGVADESRADTVLVLHEAVGDTVDATEAARWNLFPEHSKLHSIVFVRTAAGGILARISVDAPDGIRLRERSVSSSRWRSWREQLAAGMPLAEETSSAEEGLVWPERPLTPEDLAPRPEPPTIPVGEASLASDWVMLLDVGYKHSHTRFGDYFTGMMMADVVFGFAVSDHVIPFLGFQVGFGDLQDDLEDLTGNGKSAIFAFEGGGRFAAPVTQRVDLVASLAGGYYMRSLRWGGDVYYGYDGSYYGGALVRELSDWGAGMRLGFQYELSPRAGNARFLDVSLRYETYPGDRDILTSEETGNTLLAADRDGWWGVSVGFLFGL